MVAKPAHPLSAVDIIIETDLGSIVLIERKNSPHGWALPGGFVDGGETLVQAAMREAFEETSLTVTLKDQFYTYSFLNEERSCTGYTTVFVAIADGIPNARDDALQARSFRMTNLPSGIITDHQRIIRDYVRWRKNGIRPDVISPLLQQQPLTPENSDDERIVVMKRKVA